MKRSWFNLIVAPAILLALIVAPFGLYWSELPDPMAIHWSFTGEPNGSAPPILTLLLLAAIFVAMIVAVRRVLSRTPAEAPSFIAGLYAVGAILAGISWLSIIANHEVSTWSAADEVGWLQIVILLIVAAGAGWVGWTLAGGRAALGSDTLVGAAPALDVAEPGNAVWPGRALGKITTVIGVGAIIAAVLSWGWTAVILVLAGVIVLLFAVVRVTISHRGAVVSLGWWGYPSWRVPLESIARAEVETVNPMAYGGWGYRVRPGVRAVVVRGGQSLRLVRDGGTDLVYTVDGAETGAGLVNALVAARSE